MVDRDALRDMEVFLAIVDGGTLAAAARALRVTPSAVSKQMARLEDRLGVRLLQRTTRRLRLTPAGARYGEHARRLVNALAEAEADVQSEVASLRGRVRVSAPTLLGQEVVAPIIARFLRAHPDVIVELDLADRFVDLASEPIDVAVRVAARLPASDLAARRIGVIRWILVASPDYVKRRPAPRRVEDLGGHACLDLAHAEDRSRWRLTLAGRTTSVTVRGPFVSSSLIALRCCAMAGAGIAQLPAYLAHDDLTAGRLVQVLKHAELPRRAVFLVQPSRALVPPRVRAFADFLARELPAAIGDERA
ncbi:Transcriptional regulator, LysR family protein [Minicystis rosea]|nr:Transcriptional regulator, LysR family protein [Minicystis rosea]